jgi:hypothetical protein
VTSLHQVDASPVSPFALQPRDLSLASKWGLAPGGALSIERIIVIGIAVTWLPLLVASLIDGTAFGNSVAMPFLADHIPHGRFLFALPLLLLMDRIVERRTSLAIEHLHNSNLIAAPDEEKFRHIVRAAARAWRSRAVRWSLVAVTCLIAVFSAMWWRELDVSSWIFDREQGRGSLSFAGAWNLFVGVPLMRLLFLRALWKLTVWVWLLVRLSRLRLQLDPLHPDARCGLHFLGETQLAFSGLIAALGVQFGCMIADEVRFQGAELASFKLVAAAFVVLSLVLVLSPLVVFARQAWLAQERERDAFSAWASIAAKHMSSRLLQSQREHVPTQLSTSEISSMTDASALFDRVLASWPVPIDVRQLTIVVLTAAVSTLAPLLALLPLAEILQRLARILL